MLTPRRKSLAIIELLPPRRGHPRARPHMAAGTNGLRWFCMTRFLIFVYTNIRAEVPRKQPIVKCGIYSHPYHAVTAELDLNNNF
eukprot:6183031-Pleurochrysis_carterae.AAC.4